VLLLRATALCGCSLREAAVATQFAPRPLRYPRHIAVIECCLFECRRLERLAAARLVLPKWDQEAAFSE
jgi:hypothetical protein